MGILENLKLIVNHRWKFRNDCSLFLHSQTINRSGETKEKSQSIKS